MMEKYFPSGFVARPEQKRVISEIESAVQSGYEHILLCAPTGIGKSHIAATVARAMGTSVILTAQILLQDQYMRDFGL